MVTSGVPQGSVLGPVLFLAYVNDITTGVRSSMRLFADDSKVYRIIYDENDEKQLQCDLNTLQKWSEKWKLRFHPDKCEVLRVPHARDHTTYPYKLSGCALHAVTETVDLGVLLSSNLSWNIQTQKVVNKANKIGGFLKRNVGAGNNVTVNVTSTRYRNGVKNGNFVFTLTNVRFYVFPMREIILPILTNSLVVRFMLSPKRLIWGSYCLLIYPGTSKRRKL